MQNFVYCLQLISFMFLLSFFSTSCSHESTSEYRTEFSDVFTLTDSTRLEFTSESIISHILNVIFWEKQICIQQSGEFLLFDLNGNYVNKLSAKGNGPGEYNEITWTATNMDNELVIYDSELNRITIYDSQLNYDRLYSLGEEVKNYQMFITTSNHKYYFYNNDLFQNRYTIDEYNNIFEYQDSFCLFPYNSVVQTRIGGNRNLSYISKKNQLLSSHIYDSVLKIIDLNTSQDIEKIELSPKFWKPVDEETVRTLFPRISVNPRNLFKYLADKIKIWRIFCFNENLALIEYWLPKAEFILQIINIDTKQTLSTIKIPKYLGEVICVDQKNVYFAKHYYEKGNQNPSIFRFRYKY